MMSTLQARPSRPRARLHSWFGTYWPLIPGTVIAGLWLAAEVADIPSEMKARKACAQVVERLLTTHDPIELERSRILIEDLDCDVPHQLSRLPASRTGGLNS